MKKINVGNQVLVTTEYRGVFFGTLLKRKGRRVTLSDARTCLYWAKEVGGFLGLATLGPIGESRVGTTAALVELEKVTSVSLVDPKAVAEWLK